MSIPAMEGFLLITYPATLPKEGKIPVEEKIRGLTNHESILDYVDLGENGREEDGLEVRGWKIQHISDITKEQAIVKYDIKDGEFVEIEEGYEWKCYEKGRWATPGLLARIRLTRVYKIPYCTSAGGPTIDGHTSELHIAREFNKPVSSPPLMFHANEWNVAENEQELQNAKDSDGGWVPLHPDIAKGAGGWITTGFQDAYLQLLDQRKSGKDKKAVEVGGKTKSPGFFQRWLGGGK